MFFLSIRSALTIFFFVIFGIACSIPVAVVIELTKTTIDSSVIQLSVEVSDVMALSLDQDFSRGSVSTMGIVNWTHVHGDPQQSANARKFFMNRLMTASGGFYKNSWTSAFFRFGILGGIGFITKPVTGALLLQSCQSQNGFWNSTITSPSILDVYTSCDLLAYNETTLEVFPSTTSFVSPVPTLSRSFVNGPWLWNATVDLIAAARADGTLQRDSYVGFTPLYVELINAQGYGISGALYTQSSITYLQEQPTQPTALALSGLFVADFTAVFLKLLPPVPEARAFATDRFGRVAIFSHGNTVEIVTLASTGGRVYKDCVAGVYGRMACFYNISDHAQYALLRAVGIDELARIQRFQYNILHKQAGNNTSSRSALLSLSERVMEATLSQRIDSSDGETFIVTHRPLASSVLDFGFTLHVFLPVEYFTSSITQARTIVIVVAIIISIIGLGLSYCFLLIVSDRIEELAESMKDPFAPKKRREQHQRVSRNRSLNGSSTRSSKSGTIGSTLSNDSCLKADLHEESAPSGGAEVEQESKQSGGRRNRQTTSGDSDNSNKKKKKKNKIKTATKEEKEIAQDLREKRKMDEMEKREQQYLSKTNNNNEEQQKGKTKTKEKKIKKSKKNNDNNEKSKNGTSSESESEDAPRKNTNNIDDGKDDEEEVDEEEEEVEQIDEEEETEHWFRLEELCTLEKCFDDFRAVINTLRSFMPVSTALKRPSENKVAIEPSELPPATTTPIVVRKNRSASVSKDNGGKQNNQRSSKSMDSSINPQPQTKEEMGESSNDVPDALQETVANKNEQEDQQHQQLPQESLPNISTHNSTNVIGDSINNENNVDNSNKNNSNFGARTVAAVSGSRTPPATPTRSLLKNKSPSSVAGKNIAHSTSINIHNIHENHDNSNGNKKGSGDLPTPSEKSAKKSVQFAASVSLPNTSNDEIEQRNNDGSKKRSPKASAHHSEGEVDKNNSSHIDSDQSDGDVPNNHTKHAYSSNKNMENNNINNNKSIMKKPNSSASYPFSSPARAGQDMLDEFQRPVLKHRMLFAVVNIVGASACATEVAHFEANELQSQPRQQTSSHEDSQHQRKMSSSYDSSSQSFVSWAQRMQVSPRQAFVRRAEFIVETILKVIHSTGAHLVEYRGDFFLICLRINRRPQSKLAFRFVQRLIKAADDIANHPLQKPFNIGVRKTVALTAGIAVGNVQVLNMMPDTTMVIHPVVADNNNNTLSETTPTNTTNGSSNSVSASGNLNRTDSFSQIAESSENQNNNNKINSPLQIKEFILARPLTFFGGCVSEVFAVERSLQEILFPVEYVSGSYESTATSFTISSTGGASSTAVATSENAVKLDGENHGGSDDNEGASKQQHVISRRDGSAGIALALCERRPNPKDQITIQTPVAPPSSSENSSTIEKNDNDSNNNVESNNNDRHVFPSAPSKMVDHTFVLSHAIAYCVPTTHDTLAILSQNIGSCIGSNFRVLNPEYEEPPEDEERRRREKVLRGSNTNCNDNNKRRIKNRSSKTQDDNRLSLVQGEDVIGNDDDDFDEIDENNNNANDDSGPSFSPLDEHVRNGGTQTRQHPLITKTITTTTIVTDDGQEQETLTNVTFSGKQYSCENERILEELYFERFLKDNRENRKWIYCPPIARVVVAQQIGMIPVTVVVRTVTSEVNSHNNHSNKNLQIAEKKEESDSPATLNKRDLIKFNHGNGENAKKNKNNSSYHHDDERESGPKQKQEQTTTGFYSYRKIQVQRPMLMPEILKKPVPGEGWSRSNNSNNNNNNNCSGK